MQAAGQGAVRQRGWLAGRFFHRQRGGIGDAGRGAEVVRKGLALGISLRTLEVDEFLRDGWTDLLAEGNDLGDLLVIEWGRGDGQVFHGIGRWFPVMSEWGPDIRI